MTSFKCMSPWLPWLSLERSLKSTMILFKNIIAKVCLYDTLHVLLENGQTTARIRNVILIDFRKGIKNHQRSVNITSDELLWGEIVWEGQEVCYLTLENALKKDHSILVWSHIVYAEIVLINISHVDNRAAHISKLWYCWCLCWEEKDRPDRR